jgi:hypothetical protein
MTSPATAPSLGAGLMTPPVTAPALGAGLMTPPAARPEVSWDRTEPRPPGSPDQPIRVAILSFLLNWPSAGGGNYHTAELAKFLALAGYEVKHFFARYCRCLAEHGRHSGALHRAERVLAGVGTRDYYALLGQSLNDAEAVLAPNPVIAAMFKPYSSRVRIVPWGMDVARFAWPVAERPQAGETGRAAPGANGASAAGRPTVRLEGGVERPAPSAEGAAVRPTVRLEGGVERPAPSAGGAAVRPTVGPEGGVERPAPSAGGAAVRPTVGPEVGVEKASPNEAKTLDEAGPKVIVISCNSEPSPSRPRLSKQAGHSPEGASEGRSAPQPWQQFRSAKNTTPVRCRESCCGLIIGRGYLVAAKGVDEK